MERLEGLWWRTDTEVSKKCLAICTFLLVTDLGSPRGAATVTRPQHAQSFSEPLPKDDMQHEQPPQKAKIRGEPLAHQIIHYSQEKEKQRGGERKL